MMENKKGWILSCSTIRCPKCGYVYTGVHPQGDNICGYDIPGDRSKGIGLYNGEYICHCGGKCEPTGEDEIRGGF